MDHVHYAGASIERKVQIIMICYHIICQIVLDYKCHMICSFYLEHHSNFQKLVAHSTLCDLLFHQESLTWYQRLC